MAGGSEYNSHLMSSLHNGGGHGKVGMNFALFGKQDEMLKKLFGHPQEFFEFMHASLNHKDVLGGEKGFAASSAEPFQAQQKQGEAFQAVSQQGQAFQALAQQGQKGFSQAPQGSTMNPSNYMMNPMMQQMGQGLGIFQSARIIPFSGIQAGPLGGQNFALVGSTAMSSGYGGGFQGFSGAGGFGGGFSSNSASMAALAGGSGSFGGGGAAFAASGGGSSQSMGLPSMAGISFGGNASMASLGQFSAKIAGGMNLTPLGGGGMELG